MDFVIFNCSHICVCEHNYFLIASVGHWSHNMWVSLLQFFFFQLLLSFLGVQWNPPNLPSFTHHLSKMMKYVFMQLISSSVTSTKVKQGCLLQNYMPFLFIFFCLSSLLQVFGLLLHLFSICVFWRSCNGLFYFWLYLINMNHSKKGWNRWRSSF